MSALVVHRWHDVRWGVAAYNIPAFALVSTCVPTLLLVLAIPWCAYVSLPVPTPFRVLFVVVPLYSLCKKRRAWVGALFPNPLPAPWLVPHLCWFRLVARAGRLLLLSCARRGTTW